METTEVYSDTDTDAQRLLALERQIHRADRFALIFARVNALARRRELVAETKSRIGDDIRIVEIDVPVDTTDLQYVLSQRYQEEAQGDGRIAFFVYGLDRILSSDRDSKGFLPVLNYKRENLQRSVPVPVVLWLPEYALRRIMGGAPDTWAWRSGVFEFSTPQAETDRAWQQIESGGSNDEYDRMLPDERRERIANLEALYTDYSERPDADSPQLTAIRTESGRPYRSPVHQQRRLSHVASLASTHS